MTAPIHDWHPTSEPVPSPEWLATDGAAVPLLVVHVWAPWNAHDRTFDANLTAIRNDPRTFNALIRSINADLKSFWPTLKAWHVLNLPALVLVRAGQHQATVTGVHSPEHLASLISGQVSEMARSPDPQGSVRG